MRFFVPFILPNVIGSSSVHIPLLIDSQGFLAANAVDAITGRQTNFALNTVMLSGTRSNAYRVTSRGGELVTIHPVHRMVGSEVLSSLGLEHQLVPQFASVAVVRSLPTDSFDLVLGISDDEFFESCVPGSLLRAPIRGRYFGSGYSTSLDPENLIPGQFAVFYSTLYVSEVPGEIFEIVHNTFRERGATVVAHNNPRLDSRVLRFANCIDQEFLLTTLPSINLVTAGFGSLSLAPEDYVKFHPDASCDLMIVQLRDPTGQIFTFNPLAVPGINVRKSLTYTEFCDSVV